MTTMRYVFGDLRTGAQLYEISLYGVTMNDKLNGFGTLNGTFNMDRSGHQNIDLKNSTLPGKCYVVAERDNVPVWGGIVWVRTYQSQSKTMQISARTFGAYPGSRYIRTDYNVTPNVTDDQRNHFCNLWNHMQSAGSILVVVPPSTFTDNVLIAPQALATEFKTYGEMMSGIADTSDGFDWTIRVTRTPSGIYTRTLNIGYPTLGATDPNAYVFEYPGTILNYFETGSMADGATHIYVVGAGEGSTMLVGTAIHQDLLDSGWVVWDTVVSRKDMTEASKVQEFADQLGKRLKAPATFIKAFIKGDRDPIFGSYSVGDACKLVIHDANHPDPVDVETRIVAYAYTPPSEDASEEVELIFVGDELNG